MNPKAFALTKESLAADRPEAAQAAGAAMCAEVLQFPATKNPDTNGRNLEAVEAHRIVAQVRLGKHSILYRLGNDASERAEAVDELATILKRAKDKKGQSRFGFDVRICNCIAATAIDELAFDNCKPCMGSGVVRDHDLPALEGRQPMRVCGACQGQKRHRFTEDQRITKLAEEWVRAFGFGQEVADLHIIAKGIRRHKRLRDILGAVDYAKGELLTCERVAVEETGLMLERL